MRSLRSFSSCAPVQTDRRVRPSARVVRRPLVHSSTHRFVGNFPVACVDSRWLLVIRTGILGLRVLVVGDLVSVSVASSLQVKSKSSVPRFRRAKATKAESDSSRAAESESRVSVNADPKRKPPSPRSPLVVQPLDCARVSRALVHAVGGPPRW